MALWTPPRRFTLGRRSVTGAATITAPGWIDPDATKTADLYNTACSAGLGDDQLVLDFVWSSPQWAQAITVCNHNGSVGAKGRARVWTGDRLLFDTAETANAGGAWSYLWPGVPEVPYGDPRWWGFRPNVDDIKGYPGYWPVLLPEIEPFTRVRLEFSDPVNPLGRLYIGHVAVEPVIQTIRQFDKGATLGWLDAGTLTGADQGVPIGALGAAPRTFKATFSRLREHEAFGGFFVNMGEVGLVEPVTLIPDPGAGATLLHQTFKATYRTRQGIEYRGARYALTVEFTEWRG
ncbi:hypothetical protein ACIU1J_32330 [Azospirillum doebereinerae]|uniref:hypothetical protein n=1 Tax=Azospirillum doebereinerae TaxID=92933 RepID=UPI001EE4F9BA|nr:hypothetical protein [Azospirillum doebereinerae]MCG5238370.1 hypothetical protein [Azospirillum doebereinerae]